MCGLMIKQYRYSAYIGNRIGIESDWLLGISQGQIYDNLRKKFIDPHPYPFLIEDAFNIKANSAYYDDEQPLSVILARDEANGILSVIFNEQTEATILYKLCVNPEVKVMFKKKSVDKETGEVNESDFESDIEKAVHLHSRYLKEVAYLVNQMSRAVAECDDPEELGVLPESLQEAKSRLLGNVPNKRTWRDFL